MYNSSSVSLCSIYYGTMASASEYNLLSAVSALEVKTIGAFAPAITALPSHLQNKLMIYIRHFRLQ